MYYFDILDLLEKGDRLSANDIFFTLNNKGIKPNIDGIRKVLLKMFISIDKLDREARHSNTGGVKYYYFLKKTNI